MEEPQKPFVCSFTDCGKSFTNEDHLNVHTKKHDMALQFGQEQKAAFVADQTPTPTRFIRNCEEVGLFQDLQSVNPFDEGFKRAMEIKSTSLLLEPASASSDDVLHTPQTIYPLIQHAEGTLCGADHVNVELGREPSNQSLSTTIAINNPDLKQNSIDIKCTDFGVKNMILTKKLNDQVPPIMSQKSLEFVVDSLTSEMTNTQPKTLKKVVKSEIKVEQKFVPIRPLKKEIKTENDGYEVLIKLPSGRQMKMMPVEEQNHSKNLLKQALINRNKITPKVPVVTGTLIPVTILNQSGIPVTPIPPQKNITFSKDPLSIENISELNSSKDDCVLIDETPEAKKARLDLESRSAASKRYRARLKAANDLRDEEVSRLRAENRRLRADRALLQRLLAQHLRVCPRGDDLRETQEKLMNSRIEL